MLDNENVQSEPTIFLFLPLTHLINHRPRRKGKSRAILLLEYQIKGIRLEILGKKIFDIFLVRIPFLSILHLFFTPCVLY